MLGDLQRIQSVFMRRRRDAEVSFGGPEELARRDTRLEPSFANAKSKLGGGKLKAL